MIKDIISINLPEYVDILSAEVTMAEMGDMTITTDVSLPRDIIPDFSFDWKIEFRGEVYIMPLRKVQATDDSGSMFTVYSLVFLHEASYKLKTEYYVDVYLYGAGNTPIINSYNASKNLNLRDFVEDFNRVLSFYFGDSIIIDLNPSYISDDTPVPVSISNSYIWDILQFFYANYDVRWFWQTEDGVAKVKMGYDYEEVSHIFEYGFDGGLLRFERQVQDEGIRNRLVVMGSLDNLPYRYFKVADGGYEGDPDAVDELANKFFEGVMPSEFRDYVQGWKDKGGPIQTDRSAAYEQGYNDTRFKPIDYVEDLDSIAKYGVRPQVLEPNEEIKPSIQGVTLEDIGRVDELVAVEAVSVDKPYDDDDNSLYIIKGSSISESHSGAIQKEVRVENAIFEIYEITDVSFSVTSEALYTTFNSSNVEILLLDSNGDVVKADIRLGDKSIVGSKIIQDVTIYQIPIGSYQVRADFTISIGSGDRGRYLFTLSIDDITVRKDGFKQTFDIWVKNIWDSSKKIDESGDEYVSRIWDDLRSEDEMAVSFSSGDLSIADYSFRIVKIGYDNSKSIQGINSEWKLTLEKSTAEAEVGTPFIPTSWRNAKQGDYFYLLGIILPQQYVEWAEARVSQWGYDMLSQTAEVSPTWVVNTDPIKIEEATENDVKLFEKLVVGAKFRAKNERLVDADGSWISLHITSITLRYGETMLPSMDIVVSDKIAPQLSPVQSVSAEVKALSTQIAGISNIENMILAVADKFYLRKDGISQQSLSETSFSKGIQGINARKGQVGGRDWLIYKDASGNTVIETDIINVRKEFNVNNLVVNQITAIGGKQIESAAKMEVSRVDDTTEGYVCYFEQKQGSIGNLFEIEDIGYSSVSDNMDIETKYYKRKVIGVGENYVTLSKSFVNGSGIPEVGDVICHFGNYKDIDRQYVIIRDVVGGGYESMLEGLNSVHADGVEYYFAGRKQGEHPRFQIGDEHRGGLRVRMYMDGEEYKADTHIWANEFSAITPDGEFDLYDETVAAKGAADKAQADIDAMNDDGIFDITEKHTKRDNWFEISGVANVSSNTNYTDKGSYHKALNQPNGNAVALDVTAAKAAMTNAYNALRGHLNTLQLYIDSNYSPFVRTTLSEKFAAYYNAEKEVYKVISKGVKGTDGTNVTILSTSITYAMSTNGINPPTSGWQNSIPDVPQGQYLWTKTFVDYSTGDDTTSYSVTRVGVDGASGTSVTIVSTGITYQVGTSATIPPTGSWSTSIPTVPQGQFLWTRTIVNYSDGESTTAYAVSRQGQDGAPGTEGRGIASITNYYLATDASSGVTHSTTGWTASVQTTTPSEKFLWNYEKIIYTNDTEDKTPPSIIGNYSSDGSAGKGITSIVEYYAINNSTTPPDYSDFSTDVKTPTALNRYLWNYEVINYTTGSPTTSAKRIMGVYGEKGNDGLNRTTVILYKRVTRTSQAPSKPSVSVDFNFSSQNVSVEGWSTTRPEHVENTYLYQTSAFVSSELMATTIPSSAWSSPIKIDESEDVREDLNRTGIKIEQREIILSADNTIFTDSTGNPTGVGINSDGKIEASAIDVDNLEVKRVITDAVAPENGDLSRQEIEGNTIKMFNADGNLSIQLDGKSATIDDLLSGANATISNNLRSWYGFDDNVSAYAIDGENDGEWSIGDVVSLCTITIPETGANSVTIPSLKCSVDITTNVEGEGSVEMSGLLKFYLESTTRSTVNIISLSFNQDSSDRTLVSAPLTITEPGTYTLKYSYESDCYCTIIDVDIDTASCDLDFSFDKNSALGQIDKQNLDRISRIFADGAIFKKASNKYVYINIKNDDEQIIQVKDGDYELELVDSYYNVTSNRLNYYYRKWSNGWAECGGYNAGTSENSQPVNFGMTFKNASQVIISCTSIVPSTGISAQSTTPASNTTSSFVATSRFANKNESGKSTVPFFWTAKGIYEP